MKSTVLLLLGALFVVNIFFRVRLMKYFKEIKKMDLQIGMSDLIVPSRFDYLVNEIYPQHEKLLRQYRSSMLFGLAMMVAVLIILVVFINISNK